MSDHGDRIKAWLKGAPEPSTGLRPSNAWLVGILLAFSVALVVSWRYGTPDALPGVALGMPFLLELERALAIIAGLGAVLAVALLTAHGNLPTQLGTALGYDSSRPQELAAQVATLEARIDRRLEPLEDGKQTTDEALRLIREELDRIVAIADEGEG